jgi:hypothetical protein
MLSDLAEIVFVATLSRDVGPSAALAIAPRVVGEERHFGRRISEAQRVVEKEIVQFIGTDRGLGILRRRVTIAGDELRTDGVSRISSRTALASWPSSSFSATQRITCWMSVFGTLAFTL